MDNAHLIHRYQNDPDFNCMVNAMVGHLLSKKFKSSEILEALVLAEFNVEEMKRRANHQVTYTCGCKAGGDNIASFCAIHGNPIGSVDRREA